MKCIPRCFIQVMTMLTLASNIFVYFISITFETNNICLYNHEAINALIKHVIVSKTCQANTPL